MLLPPPLLLPPLLLFSSLACVVLFSRPVHSSYESEHQQLLSLFTALSGPHWTSNTYWTEVFLSHCEWKGVLCNSQHSVSSLQLPNNNLKGSLDVSSLVSFPSLEILNLAQNKELNVAGSPTAFSSSLPNLHTLILRDCNLDFPLFHPETRLPSLTTLLVENNSFEVDLSKFNASHFAPNLEVFWADFNRITGDLSDLMKLPSLIQLSLANNHLIGSTGGLGRNLRYLNLGNNPSMDVFFQDFFVLRNFSPLTHLILPNISLRGVVHASDLLLIPRIKVLRIEDNNLADPFPWGVLSSLPDLVVLNINDNQLYSSELTDAGVLAAYSICPQRYFSRGSECFSCSGWNGGVNISACFLGQTSCDLDKYNCDIIPGYSDPIIYYQYDNRITGWILVSISLFLFAISMLAPLCRTENYSDFDDLTQLSQFSIEY